MQNLLIDFRQLTRARPSRFILGARPISFFFFLIVHPLLQLSNTRCVTVGHPSSPLTSTNNNWWRFTQLLFSLMPHQLLLHIHPLSQFMRQSEASAEQALPHSQRGNRTADQRTFTLLLCTCSWPDKRLNYGSWTLLLQKLTLSHISHFFPRIHHKLILTISLLFYMFLRLSL